MKSVEKAILQILIGECLNKLGVDDIKLLPATDIKQKLLESLDVGSEYFNAADESTLVDAECQTTQSIDHYSSTFWGNEMLQSSSMFSRPPLIDEWEKPLLQHDSSESVAKNSADTMEYSSSDTLLWNKKHGNIKVSWNAAADGVMHFLRGALKAQGRECMLTSESNASLRMLIGETNAPLGSLTKVFHVPRGIEQLIKRAIELKRSKEEHNGDYHNSIVQLLRGVCAVNSEIREYVLEIVQKLLKSASFDEEDMWVIGLLIEDLCADRDTCFLCLEMLRRLILCAIEDSQRQDDHTVVTSSYGFCLIITIKSILEFPISHLESDDKATQRTLNQYINFKSGLMEILTKIKDDHLFLLISNEIQDIFADTQKCIDYVKDKCMSMICD